METYKDLLDRKPREAPATVTIDGVEAELDYSLEQYGIIDAMYTEMYTRIELCWLQGGEVIELTGKRTYFKFNGTERVISKIEMIWRNGAKHTDCDSITHIYPGESRRCALLQLQTIVTAARAAIDAIGNADNPDFEAELDTAVRESVTGGEAE